MIATRKNFDTTAEALEYLREARQRNPEGPPVGPKGLGLTDIIVCEKLFQRRDTFGNRLGREEHVRDLKRAIQEHPDQMEPVSVWWGGEGWFLLDGHHRVMAYERLKFSRAIPVRVIEGSLEDALAHVGEANTRNKLPMTKEERMGLAVFYECVTPGKSLRDIARISGVSKSQVSTIRKAIDQLVAGGETRENLAGLPWAEIRRMTREEGSYDFDYDEEARMIAEEIKAKLGPILGNKPQRHAEALAMALEELSPALWQRLQEMTIPQDEPEEELEDLEY